MIPTNLVSQAGMFSAVSSLIFIPSFNTIQMTNPQRPFVLRDETGVMKINLPKKQSEHYN